MTSVILAVDIGTTSTKGLAVTAAGEVISTHQEFYPTHHSLSGFAEQDPAVIFQAVVRVIEAVAKKIIGYPFEGICFSAAMHSLMAVDELGAPITPLIIWADTRSVLQAKKIKSSGIAQELYKTSGTPIHPMSPLCKLMWWQENDPELVKRAAKFISIKEYVVHQLTGEYKIDYSIASATGLFSISELTWLDAASALHKIPPEKFSIPVSIYHQLTCSREWQGKIGIKGPIKIMMGASDGCCAQLGSNAMGEGDMSVTLGTSGAVRVTSKNPVFDLNGGIFNYLLEKGTFISGGATNNGTAILNWYTEKVDLTSSANLIDFVKEVDQINAGADGLIVLPFLLGERAPMYDAQARGVFFGVSINHTKSHFQKALLEGICFELKSIVRLIERSVGASKRILLSGGITHSASWTQMLSNVLGRPLIIADQYDASALGAARIGFKAIGIEMEIPTYEAKTVFPDAELSKRYDKQFEIFEVLYKQLATSFQKLADIKK